MVSSSPTPPSSRAYVAAEPTRSSPSARATAPPCACQCRAAARARRRARLRRAVVVERRAPAGTAASRATFSWAYHSAAPLPTTTSARRARQLVLGRFASREFVRATAVANRPRGGGRAAAGDLRGRRSARSRAKRRRGDRARDDVAKAASGRRSTAENREASSRSSTPSGADARRSSSWRRRTRRRRRDRARCRAGRKGRRDLRHGGGGD